MNTLHQLIPGMKIANDWCDFPIPLNMVVGQNTVIDSSSVFRKFFSECALGLKLGNNITIQSCDLATEKKATIEIGDNSYLMGASLIAQESIKIGSFVYIGFGVVIVDTDFHPIDAGERLEDTVAISSAGDKSKRPTFKSHPVVIEDDVWIGFNATILKGITIGKGSIIHPGAVVSKSFPPGSVISGNPATSASEKK